MRHHFIRDCVHQKAITVVKVATDDNIADSFTKALTHLAFSRFARELIVHIGDAA